MQGMLVTSKIVFTTHHPHQPHTQSSFLHRAPQRPNNRPRIRELVHPHLSLDLSSLLYLGLALCTRLIATPLVLFLSCLLYFLLLTLLSPSLLLRSFV